MILPSALCLVAPLAQDAATLELPAVLSSGMVLQREADVPLWGRERPGTAVTIRPSWSDSTWTVLSDEEGRWRADIPTGPAGGPHAITLTGSREVVLEDVLFGEVWLCSGQSNMEWYLSRIWPNYEASDAYDERIGTRTRDDLRVFNVARKTASEPQEDCGGAWSHCTPESTENFSAVGYFFGCALADALDVPVGLVGSNWGGTPVRAWSSADVVRKFPDLSAQLDRKLAALQPQSEDGLAAAIEAWWTAADQATGAEAAWAKASHDDTNWTPLTAPGLWESGPLGAVDGVVWFRKPIEAELQPGADYLLDLGPIDDNDRTFFNGIAVGSTQGHLAQRRYHVPGELVQATGNVVTVQVHDSGGAGGLNGSALRLVPKGGGDAIDLSGEWRARHVGMPPGDYPRQERFESNTPTSLYNGMIAPLVPFRFSGAIWYQGESDRARPDRYKSNFPAMIVDWRQRFELAEPGFEMPFFWAQIAPFDYSDSSHLVALQHEAQDAALALPRTGQVILTDVGNVRDIHPKNKWTVGERFALHALATAYGRELDPDGPRYASHEIDGDTVRVRFANAGGGLLVRGATNASWFHVAGDDRRFHPAIAVIEGDVVLVTCEAVPNPVAVRFGWSDIAEPNLFDGDGLPAAPFRTDDWDDVPIED